MGDLPDGVIADPPVGSNCGERLKDEASLGKVTVRDGQSAGMKLAAAPKCDIEIKDPAPPSSAAAAAEFPLEVLEPAQHFGRLQRALYKRDGMGEVASRFAERGVEHDGGGIE